ncbi:MAG: T9SS type A sorting domain-containing protein [Flavobacteriales bacterium]|nr:T9SS type A sorting domain-containing protein [Flavobacteriales bacterium]MCX7767742.1 T9SS type A sorting domain-containing protein [Flavobacteriales bacterium]MDW8409363.1 T9SS type A sorting domain-containing protein [Flavobacteriales bacterium]
MRRNALSGVASKMTNYKYTGEEILPLLITQPKPYVAAGYETYEKVVNQVMVTKIGMTRYDLQTNYSVANRIKFYPDKTVTCVWTMSKQDTPWQDRGTGYNYWDGTSWAFPDPGPANRIESVRIGWPSLDFVETVNKKEFVISHNAATVKLHIIGQANKGSMAWTGDTDINSLSTLWPRCKTGGPDGSTIHCISTTDPAGSPYQGIVAANVYSRSLDGGATWDQVMTILPGMDSTQTDGGGGDTYAIDVRGNTVVAAFFNTFEPSYILKSTDNGNTWTKTVFVNTGFGKYKVDGQISDLNNDNIPDTITSTDQSGAVLLDQNNVAHVFFGVMRYLDDVDTGGTYSYFPATSGLFHWAEGMAQPELIADLVDENANGTIDITSVNEIAQFFTSLTSHPTATLGPNGEIAVAYSGLDESRLSASGTQLLRRLYFVKSLDGGVTWSEPVQVAEDGDDYGEYMFATLAPNSDENIRLWVQRDYESGLTVRGDQDPPSDNDILYLQLTWDFEDAIGLKNNQSIAHTARIYPNPASQQIFLSVDLKKAGMYGLFIFNSLGSQVYATNVSLSQGVNSINLPIENLSPGLYHVVLSHEHGRLSVPFIKK